MWGLLHESLAEVLKHWKQLVQCFWPAVVLLAIVLVYAMVEFVLPIEMKAAIALVMLVAVAPGACRWHRYLIGGEAVRWLPAMPNRRSISYFFILLASVIASGAISKITDSVVFDLVMPIIGLTISGDVATEFATVWRHAPFLGVAIGILVYTLIVGPWLLLLPERALDRPLRGVGRTWFPSGKQSFVRALFVVHVLPAFVGIALKQVEGLNFIWVFIAVILADVVASVVGLSLITVTYRRNLNMAKVM